MSITQPVCAFVPLEIQHVMRMRRIMWLFPLYRIFPHYLTNGTIFGKTLLAIKCVFRVSLQILSEIFFIIIRTERYIIKSVYRS